MAPDILWARAAAKVAGFHPHHSHRLMRRLAAEIEQERHKLIAIARRNGQPPGTLPKAAQERMIEALTDVS
jgi:hypothetical protein